jgi:putative ABC transport system permease protein
MAGLRNSAARMLLGLAAALAPRRARDDFLREWRAELWHEAHGSHGEGSAMPPISATLGAFKDAVALRAIERGRAGDTQSGLAGGLHGLVTEVRFALRGLRRSPMYASMTILTLAIGLGGSTAIAILLHRVVLEPLPYPEADRLVQLKNKVPGVDPDEEWNLASAQYFYYGEHAATIEQIGAVRHSVANVQTPAGPRRISTAVVSASAISMIGARASLGRLIDQGDDTPDAPPVVVLSHGLWTREFGSDPGVLGRSIAVNEQQHEIVGVLGPEVTLPPVRGASTQRVPDLWLPMQLNPAGPFINNHVIPMLARLSPGADAAAAEAELARLQPRLPEAFPNVYYEGFFDRYGFQTVAYPLKQYSIGQLARDLWILAGAVGLVLAIAVANVLNLFLVRMEGRRRELAIRAALGAGRMTLARAILAESLSLSFMGGLLGLVIGFWSLSVLISLTPASLPRLDHVGLDPGVIALMAILSLLLGIMIAGVPILQRANPPQAHSLAEGGRLAGEGPQRQRLRSGLVIAQVALALTLTVAAGLLVESVKRLRAVDPGVDADGVLAAQLYLVGPQFQSTDAMWQVYDQVLERIRALPGVSAAGMSQELPLSGGYGCTIQGFQDQTVYERLRDDGMTTCAGQESTTPGYLEAMGIPLLRGRAFIDADNDDPSTGSVIVSQAFARRFWPGEDPLGKGVAPNGRTEGPFYRVVGLVGDVYRTSLDGEIATAIYYPVVRIPQSGGWWPDAMSLVVRSEFADAVALLPAISQAVHEVVPSVPVANAQTMQAIIDDSMSRLTFTLLLLEVAAAMALLLAAIGLYGVISYLVTRRTREIGVRMAVGANARQVVRLVIGKSLALAGVGMALGVGTALAATRVMRGLLYGVSPTHPQAFAAAVCVLGGVALLASWLPARRAARTDPALVLREE